MAAPFLLFHCSDFSRSLQTVADSIHTDRRDETCRRRRCEMVFRVKLHRLDLSWIYRTEVVQQIAVPATNPQQIEPMEFEFKYTTLKF